MASSGSYKIVTMLKVPPSKAPPHVLLANLVRDDASLRGWRKRWGNLLSTGRARELGIAVDAPGQRHIISGELLAAEFELQERLRRAWRGDKDALRFIQQSVAKQKGTWEFQSGRIELIPEDLWTALCMIFLQDHAEGRAACCAQTGCPTPYFRRSRATQVYCSADCQAAALREQKRHWWNANRANQITKLG